jgi:hypothetical protein
LRTPEQRILSALDDHIAVLDRHGNITYVNESWIRFAHENGARPASTGVGINYLEICRRSLESCPEVQQLLAGIQAVMDGSSPHFRSEYRCDSPTEQRWFEMRVNPLATPEDGIVLCHSDTSELTKASSMIRSRIGVSRLYASRIRQGYRPHPRHWQALAGLTGVLADGQ